MVKGTTGFGEMLYVGARYDYWKVRMQPGAEQPDKYEFYAAKTPTKAWLIFLGVIDAPSAIDDNRIGRKKTA